MKSALDYTKEQKDAAPVRSRGANMVAEARIIRAGGGITGISRTFQSFVYVVLVAVLAVEMWMVLVGVVR